MKTPAWIPSALCLLAACDPPSNELGSTRVTWSWVSPDDEPIDAVATTPDDEIVVTLSSQDQARGTLRKHGPDGSIAWERDAPMHLVDVAVDPTGAIVALGVTADDAGTLLAHAPDGTPQWTVPLPEGTQGRAIEVLGDGTILVATNTSELAELRGYSPAGAPGFIQPLASEALELELRPRVSELATSPAGHVVAAGYLPDEVGTWVARVTATGEPLWLDTSALPSVDAIAIDDDGAPFMIGHVQTNELEPLVLLLRRYDAAGGTAWEHLEPRRQAHAAAIGEDGTLFWAGVHYETSEAIVVALEPDGTERWDERSSGPRTNPDENYAIGLALAPTGELVAAGALDYRGTGGSGAWFRGWLGRYYVPGE